MRACLSLLLIFLSFNTFTQVDTNRNEWVKPRDFGRYFLADRYAPIVKLGVGLMKVIPDYDISEEPRSTAIVAEPVLGAQVPLYNLYEGQHRFAISFPISFSVWFDFKETRTAPILNTDYRFAVPEFNYNYSFKSGWLDNIGVKFIPFFHESTHIGDEILIDKIRDSIPMARINVSYETFEIACVLNDPLDRKIRNNALRVGAKFLWNPKKGFYSSDSLERSPNLEIDPSTRWIEPYIQYQYQDRTTWVSFKGRALFVASVDLYLRVRYGYPYSFLDDNGNVVVRQDGEAYQLCTNVLVGWKFLQKKKKVSDVGVFLHGYYGINPHGQFRNISNYPFVGIKLIYDLL